MPTTYKFASFQGLFFCQKHRKLTLLALKRNDETSNNVKEAPKRKTVR